MHPAEGNFFLPYLVYGRIEHATLPEGVASQLLQLCDTWLYVFNLSGFYLWSVRLECVRKGSKKQL